MKAFTARELAKLEALLKADWEATLQDVGTDHYSNDFGCPNCGDIWGTSAVHDRLLANAKAGTK